MLNWIKSLLRRTDPAPGAEATGERPEVRPVCASTYEFNDIGELCWDSDHNSDRLTVTGDGLTIEWDEDKNKADEKTPCWVPASTRLFLHSGQFSLDFRIDEMAERQMGVGFMLQLTDGVNVGGDWGFFGYLGSSNTAWAYDPSTGDVVTATESIEGGLPKIDNGHSGLVRMRVRVPRHESGFVMFMMNGVESRPISLPVGSVILPAACFLKTGQKVTLSNFLLEDVPIGKEIWQMRSDLQDELYDAITHGNIHDVEALLKAGADASAFEPGHWTPLMVAAEFDNVAIARLLLDSGADVNRAGSCGYTALQIAVDCSLDGAWQTMRDLGAATTEMVSLLLERGASVSAVDYQGETARDLAARYGPNKILDLLRSWQEHPKSQQGGAPSAGSAEVPPKSVS